jgi:hypothetical protein NreA
MYAHDSHEKIVKRLTRAKGHLESVIKMIKDEKPCLDVAQQFHAVTNALINAKQLYINDHIEHCFDDEALSSPEKVKTSLEEFKKITKYLK